MTFHIITIFPEIFESYFSESIVKRAREKKLVDIKIYNLRDYTKDTHRTVDDTPYGGGAGMLLKIEPIWRCVQFVKSKVKRQKTKGRKIRTTMFCARGKRFDQTQVKRLTKYTDIIMICGRYEGIDDRVSQHIADETISIGEFILTGGEIPAMVVVDSITRLIPGALGNVESSKDESFAKEGYLEYPQYTKPEEFRGWKVPEVLVSGDHKKIEEWRKKKAKKYESR